MGLPGDSVVNNPSVNAGVTGGTGSTPGLGRSPGKGNGHLLEYSRLEKTRDRGTLWATVVHGITKRNDLATEQQQQILKSILWKERYGISSLFRNGPRKPMWERW